MDLISQFPSYGFYESLTYNFISVFKNYVWIYFWGGGDDLRNVECFVNLKCYAKQEIMSCLWEHFDAVHSVGTVFVVKYPLGALCLQSQFSRRICKSQVVSACALNAIGSQWKLDHRESQMQAIATMLHQIGLLQPELNVNSGAVWQFLDIHYLKQTSNKLLFSCL